MAQAVSSYNLTINDNTLTPSGKPESGSVGFDIITLTAGNLAATELLLVDLVAAIDDIQIGNVAKTSIVLQNTIVSGDRASSKLAQRENKLLLRYHDNTVPAWKYERSIPCFDLTTLPDGSEFLDLTTGVGAALKSAFEAVVVSFNDASHTVTLDSAQFVGRNS